MNDTLQRVLAELPEVRERADRATAGDWKAAAVDKFGAQDHEIDYVTNIYGSNKRICEMVPSNMPNVDQHWSDAEFIAHAREDVPKLCDALQTAAEEIEQLREALQVYADDSNWSSDWGWKGINDPTLIAKRELGGKQG